MAGDADDPRTELSTLASALLAHAQWLADTGAPGLDRATAELIQARAGDVVWDSPPPGARPEQARSGGDVGPARNRREAGPEASRTGAPRSAQPPPTSQPRSAPASQPQPRSAPAAQPPSAPAAQPPRAPAPQPPSAPAAQPPSAPAAQPPRAPAAQPPSAPALATQQAAPSASASRVALDPVERRRRLATLAEEVAACTACVLNEARKQTVFARGDGSAGLCFVGEGPGADEDEQGLPFVGKAGQLLDRMIAAMGFDADEVYICNIVKCRPPQNRKPQPEEMAACRPYLEQQLELLDPTVIVALGATAVQGLLGTTEGITRLRGKWKLYKGRIAVMPTFHPAYLLRTPSAKRVVWEDLQAVMRQLGRPIPERK